MIAVAVSQAEAKALGVTVEAEYTVGEYDIVILSAKESMGLQTWLQLNGYKIPLGADRALEPYIRSDMKFFVAKVNLTEHNRTGLTYLRPLQFAFESPKFMLPIRLGMINSQGPQDLVVYMLTENGRVETTNYRTVKLPTGMDIPRVRARRVRRLLQGDVRRAGQAQRHARRVHRVRVEHGMVRSVRGAAAVARGIEEPRRVLARRPAGRRDPRCIDPAGSCRISSRGGPMPVMLTRLHVRYSADTFPEDLIFQETQDQENFQARYVMHRAWDGSPTACEGARNYFEELNKRKAQEAETLADLTGWNLQDVIKKAGLPPESQPKPWWQGIWGS